MVKNTLFIKSINDMKKNLSQFVSIFIMAAVSVSIVVGIDSIWMTVENHSAQMYSATNLSDLWISVINPTENNLWKIENIDGVKKVEKRFIINSNTKLPGNPTLQVYASPSSNTLDMPYIYEGKKISKGGAVLDKSFAKIHNLSIGDKIDIKVNNHWLQLTIEALAYSSEHIFSIKDSTTILPNPAKYGFITVDADKIKSAYGGMKPYNQLSVQLEGLADSDKVQKEIDNVLGDDLIGVISRSDNRSVNSINGRITQFKTLSRVFPIMFFIVTALITLSTMSRLVEDQRNQIGILKALGYRKKDIVWHYTSYGVIIGLLGAAFGTIMGPNIISKILINNMKFLFVFPDYHLSLNYKNIILSTILIVLCTGGVSCYSCLRLQEENPSMLLRDKPPNKGNHVILEKIPRIWDSMKFSSKLISRNIFKNKVRMIMSIIGVMGCTGLILGAFIMREMVNDISQITFEKVYTYDQKIILDSKTTKNDIKNLSLNATVQNIEESAMQVTTSDGTRKIESVTILPQNSPLVHLMDTDKNSITLPDDGVVITRKLSERLNVKEGDSINIKRFDDSYISVKVNKIIYMVIGQGIYMSDTAWDKLGEDFKPTAILVKWNTEDLKFLNSDYVNNYISRTEQMADYKSNLKVVDISSVILIIAGGILAFVVLYNMSILNFFERIRDLATFKVLGFYEKEIRSLVLVENLLSAIIGIIMGIPIGKLISMLLASGFGYDVDSVGYLSIANLSISGLITILFTVIVNIVVSKKIKTIDMLESLKSVE